MIWVTLYLSSPQMTSSTSSLKVTKQGSRGVLRGNVTSGVFPTAALVSVCRQESVSEPLRDALPTSRSQARREGDGMCKVGEAVGRL